MWRKIIGWPLFLIGISTAGLVVYSIGYMLWYMWFYESSSLAETADMVSYIGDMWFRNVATAVFIGIPCFVGGAYLNSHPTGGE